jgi:MoaA/NifB/PqqE/SkfB family radical SAM enzyme
VKAVITPKILTFFVTNQCNAKCKHCFNWQASTLNELSLKEIQKIDLDIFTSISITGGEPTLRPDLSDICQQAAKKNKIYLNTNGLIPQHIAEVIKKVDTNKLSVTVSLDATKELHDQIRGIACFDSAVKTINLCKNAGVDVTIITTLSRFNITAMPQFIEHLKTEKLFTKKGDITFNIARGLQHVFNLDPSQSFYHNPKDNNTVLTLTELKEAYAQIKQYMTNQNSIVWHYSLKMLSEHKKLVTCQAGNIDMILYANGNVAACEYTKPFANIRNYNFDLLTLWNSKTAQNTRNKLNNCYCTHPCNLNTAIPRTLKGLLKLAPDIAKNKTRQLKNKLDLRRN